MRTRTTSTIGSAFVVAVLVVVAGVLQSSQAADAAKKITFSTKSKEAIANVEKIVKAIESLQAPPQWIQYARSAVELDPEFAFGHYLVATGLMPQPESQEHAKKAVELSKKASDGERRYIEAVFLARSQQDDKAAAIFEDLAKQYPEERMVQMMLGQVYTNKGSLDQAKAAFTRAIQLDGSTPRAYNFLGNIELLRGEYAGARGLFSKAIEKKAPGTLPFGAHYGVAYSYVYEGKLDLALEALYRFRDQYEKAGGLPNLPAVFVWNSIGRILLENGRPEEAIKAYQKGFETVPGSSLSDQDKKIWLGRMHHGRGRALAKMGKHDEAWKEAETIMKMIEAGGEAGKQFMPSYHYIAGYLKLEGGDFAKAIEHLKQSDLTDPFHKLLLARAYEKTGDQNTAQNLYKEIVSFRQITLERALAYPEAKKKLRV